MHLPRWRREQKKQRRLKFVILLRLILVFVLVAAVSLIGLWFWKTSKSSKLPKTGRVTVVFSSHPLLIVSLNEQQEMVIVSIPDKTHVETTHGFGSYRLGAVWALGKQEKIGGALLAETVQELLGIPVDGWVGPDDINSEWTVANTKNDITDLKNKLTSLTVLLNPKQIINLKKNVQTNLSIFDLARFWYSARSVRFDKIIFVDLEKTPALATLSLADGSQALTADTSLIDKEIKDLYKDNRIVDEHLLIEVLNGTDKPGLANRIARLIVNLGGTVVSIGNISKPVKNCQLSGDSQALQSFTSQRIALVFNCQTVPATENLRADLQILIGEDYWQRLFKR